MTEYRSVASLLLSGAATITLDQRGLAPRLRSTREALAADREAIRADARRVMRSLNLEQAGS